MPGARPSSRLGTERSARTAARERGCAQWGSAKRSATHRSRVASPPAPLLPPRRGGVSSAGTALSWRAAPPPMEAQWTCPYWRLPSTWTRWDGLPKRRSPSGPALANRLDPLGVEAGGEALHAVAERDRVAAQLGLGAWVGRHRAPPRHPGESGACIHGSMMPPRRKGPISGSGGRRWSATRSRYCSTWPSA
jgi:hypothetical protein